MMGFQNFSLMYRFAVISEDKSVYHLFMTKKVHTVLIILNQVVSIGLGYGFYSAILEFEVCLIEIQSKNILG